MFVAANTETPEAVRASVLAALGMDWPADRLAVWLVDEAAAPEREDFAASAGCLYLAAGARSSGRIGLLNEALSRSQADVVATFEAGDIPTRAFLQLTLGWLLACENLGFVQGELATSAADRPWRAGSDTFDATAWAGSGAVLRRAALESVGGFASSPARTSRLLRRRGWRGAYIGLPLAGGRHSGRITARLVWTLLGGLAVCSALLPALGVPALAVAAYAGPHLLLAALTTLRLLGLPRRAHAVPALLSVVVTLPDSTQTEARADSPSRYGATLHAPVAAASGTMLQVGLGSDHEAFALAAQVADVAPGQVRVVWRPATMVEEARLVRAVYGRADAWVTAPERRWLHRLLPAALAAAGLLAASVQAHAQGSIGDTAVRPIPGGAAETLPQADNGTVGARTVVYTLHQLGAAGPLALRGTQPVLAVPFGVRADEVVTAATLNLEGAISPALLPALSNVTVTLNGQYIATIPADRHTPAFAAEVPITPSLFQATDRLEFRLAGRAQADCDDPLSPLLWATVADSSTLTLTLARLPPQRDLARLPKPFFDEADGGGLVLPFVLPPSPDSQALRAAGIAAGWFGQLAGPRGARFPVAGSVPASGDAVVLQVEGEGTAWPGAPVIDGPTLAVLANPRDPFGSLLLIGGRTDAEAVTAARALAFGIRALSGAIMVVRPPDVAARVPYDAPAWMATNRPVRLGTLVATEALQGVGYAGQLTVPFRTAPDLYSWRGRPFDLDLRWRAPPGPVVDLAASRLDVGLDGDYLASLSLARDRATASRAQVAVPAYDVSGDDSLQLAFDTRPLRRTACAAIPGDLRMAVDADSTLDLSRAHHIARLPNLGFFVATGFPFTRLADLSQTAIVLPEQPSEAETGAFLGMMGRLGAASGLPGGEVAVVRPGEVASVADRDFLVLGTLAGLQSSGLAGLLDDSPVGFADGGLHVRLGAGQSTRAAAAVSAGFTSGVAVLVGGQSPLHAGRSVVALVAADAAALEAAMASLDDPAQRRQVQGDVALLSGGQVTAYRVGPTYTVGSLPFWLWPSWYLADHPVPTLLLLLAGCALLGIAAFWWLSRRAAARLPQPKLR